MQLHRQNFRFGAHDLPNSRNRWKKIKKLQSGPRGVCHNNLLTYPLFSALIRASWWKLQVIYRFFDQKPLSERFELYGSFALSIMVVMEALILHRPTGRKSVRMHQTPLPPPRLLPTPPNSLSPLRVALSVCILYIQCHRGSRDIHRRWMCIVGSTYKSYVEMKWWI